MTAPRATIPLQLQDESLHQIEFVVITALTSEMLDSVQLYLNDVPIDISYTITEQGVLYRGVIPPGTVNLREIDDLEFRVPHLDTVPDTDVQLGIAVDWVMFDRSPGT